VPEASLLNPLVVNEIVGGFPFANVADNETIAETKNKVTSTQIKSFFFAIRFNPDYVLRIKS
jgi:hypothetical protein